MRQVARLFRERGSAEYWPVLLGAVARTLGVAPAPPPLPNIRDPGLHLGFFSRTLDFDILPRKFRPPLAISAEIGDKARAWDWLVAQVRAGVPDPEWIDSESLWCGFSAELGIAAIHSVWARSPRPSSLRCGTR